jgi:hypothetical protein
MQSSGKPRQSRAASLIGGAFVALLLAACSVEADEGALSELAQRQANTTPVCTEDKFTCDCKKIGGTVDGPGWCCKHDADGSSTCTNAPDLIISWHETPPGPDRPPHVTDIEGVKIEVMGYEEPKESKPDLSDPAFASACESVKRLAAEQKGAEPEFDPSMPGFPGQSEKFSLGKCFGFCSIIENACDFVLCAPDDTLCHLNCMTAVGGRCQSVCLDLYLAAD